MIELKNLSIETRHKILTDVNFIFLDNKIYGIVAENGSGKTTLFRTLVNLRKRKNGIVLFDLHSSEKMMKDIFYFESIEWLDKNLNGLDYMKFVKNIWKSNKKIDDVIKDWSMEDYIKLPIKKYSLGMKQRLVIGLYIISDAKYLIMDEITNGLDEDNRKHFFHQILELKEEGKTILISSHYKDEIVQHCDCVLQIHNTKLVEVSS
ncbi:ATP-binding cassette domain-containing protein [Amedibacillus sp. YH-ame6]